METRKIIYLLAFAIAVLAIFFGCSCDREEPDVVAPSVPSGLNSTSTTNSINLSWSASTDNVGVVGYKIFRDGVSAGNATSTSFIDKNLVPNSSYVYTVSAVDANGNVSKLSAPYTAKTVDDCPTCSKWMTEINFIQPSVDIINAGESKSAGSLIVKNISTSTHTANLTLTFSGAGASAVDSLNYTIGGQTTKQKVENNSVTLNQVSVPANSSTEIKLVYRIKETIPAGIVDQSQITLLLTATTTDEAGITQPRNGIFPSMNLDKLHVPAKSTWVSSVSATYGEQFAIIGNAVSNELTLTINNSASVNKTLTSLTANFGVNGSAVKMLRYLNSDGKWVVLEANNGEIVFSNLVLKPGVNAIKSFFALKPQVGVANNSKLEFTITGLNDGAGGKVPATGNFPNTFVVGTVNASVQPTVLTTDWWGQMLSPEMILQPGGETLGAMYAVLNLRIEGPGDVKIGEIKLKNPYASYKDLIFNQNLLKISINSIFKQISNYLWQENKYIIISSPNESVFKSNFSYNDYSVYFEYKNSGTKVFNSDDYTSGLCGFVLESKFDLKLLNSNNQVIDLSDVKVRQDGVILQN